MRKTVLEQKIEQIGKKLNIFNEEDIEVLIDNISRVEIVSTLELMVKKKIFKHDGNHYIYISKAPKKKTDKSYTDPLSKRQVKSLPFKPTKPKEVFFRHINEMEGFTEYFFSTKACKDRIKKILKVLKAAH